MELPQCNIDFSLPLPQKVRRVADRAKALEEIVAKMEEDNRGQIAELEARAPGTPQEDKEAKVEAFQLTSAQIKSRIDDALSVLADATSAWSELDEPPQKVEIQQSIHQIENTTTTIKEEIKSLAALQKMRKTKEMNRL